MQKYLNNITYSRVIDNVTVVNVISVVRSFKLKKKQAKDILKTREIENGQVSHIETTLLQ